MASARKKAGKTVKVIDEAAVIRCVSGDGLIREETWEDSDGNVVRYNLAFINSRLFAKDNGRVLGYDTAHGQLHRHYAGTVEIIDPAPYRQIHDRFVAEVAKLKKRREL